METFARLGYRVKMAEIPLLFVEKLVNNALLASFSASISEISSDFSFDTDSCKDLISNKLLLSESLIRLIT